MSRSTRSVKRCGAASASRKRDGVTLFESPDLLGVGHLADAANRARHGDVVTFAANQHINPTNICVLRKTCVFCGYARLPKEAGAYRYTIEQVLAEAEQAADGMTREFHIVGGLDMQAGLEYYTTMFRALKRELPHVHIKALTAVEIAHIARIEKLSWTEVLIALREAGLDTMPGGGAETFSAAVRDEIADKKLGGADYIGVHRAAHALGIRTNCTMLYGHVETIDDRIEHLQMLRDLQDETGGFLAYIPLAYHPDDNELGEKLGRQGIQHDRLRRPPQPRGRPALPRQLRAHQVALDHGHAVPLADRAALRRERPRGDRGAREDLPRRRCAPPSRA
ncbi:MAG: radical SAM protein [Gemmatimonadaceae bacterium]|nr:radical SAM protein [Gemmatimonadaceae bacterium]